MFPDIPGFPPRQSRNRRSPDWWGLESKVFSLYIPCNSAFTGQTPITYFYGSVLCDRPCAEFDGGSKIYAGCQFSIFRTPNIPCVALETRTALKHEYCGPLDFFYKVPILFNNTARQLVDPSPEARARELALGLPFSHFPEKEETNRKPRVFPHTA